jgi:hypothetical protein
LAGVARDAARISSVAAGDGALLQDFARQLTEACGWSEQPRYIIRDRDGTYGDVFIRRLTAMGIRDRDRCVRNSS